MGYPTAAWDQTREVGIIPPGPREAARVSLARAGWDARKLGSRRPDDGIGCVGRHEVRTYKCVCDELLGFRGLEAVSLGWPSREVCGCWCWRTDAGWL
jgi:hypothetical protein